jgi:hypothetical protein
MWSWVEITGVSLWTAAFLWGGFVAVRQGLDRSRRFWLCQCVGAAVLSLLLLLAGLDNRYWETEGLGEWLHVPGMYSVTPFVFSVGHGLVSLVRPTNMSRRMAAFLSLWGLLCPAVVFLIFYAAFHFAIIPIFG